MDAPEGMEEKKDPKMLDAPWNSKFELGFFLKSLCWKLASLNISWFPSTL